MPLGGGAGGVGGGGGGGIGGFGGGWFAGGSHTAGRWRGGGIAGCVFVLIMGVILILSIALGVTMANRRSETDIATDFYSPGDSRLLSFSPFFCESVDMDIDSTDTGAFIALLNSPPTLTDTNSFNISEDQTRISPTRFRFWQYHLYPNSNISIRLCIERNVNAINVYLVKGNSNANRWARSPSTDHSVLFRSVRTTCPQESVLTYPIEEEDEYYVFVYNPTSDFETDITFSSTLEYERFEYALPTNNPELLIDFCFARSGGRCSVDIPYGTGTQLALVVTTIPEGVNWGENVDVNLSCNRRDWAYVIVVLIPLLTVIGVIVCIVVGVCLCYKYL